MLDIVLTTLNARYEPRVFRPALSDGESRRPADRARDAGVRHQPAADRHRGAILAQEPRIVGIGVYIWNAQQTEQARRAAETRAAGPHRHPRRAGSELRDRAAADRAEPPITSSPAKRTWRSRSCAGRLLSGRQAVDERSSPRTLPEFGPLSRRWHRHTNAATADNIRGFMNLPYDLYTDEDIAHRVIYVEASRGCPFKCEFCLSSLDVPVRNVPLDAFLAAMQRLLDRGAAAVQVRRSHVQPEPEHSAGRFSSSSSTACGRDCSCTSR